MAPIVPLDVTPEWDDFPPGYVDVVCPTVRPTLANELAEGLHPFTVKIHDGSGANNFSELCNSVIDSSSATYVVIANDKARPKPHHLIRMLRLLDDGYGLVGLYRFGFFGFNRELMQSIGKFDENFADGGFEDNDLILRFKYLNLAMYLSEETDYLKNISTSWGHVKSRIHFHRKYSFSPLSKVILIDSGKFLFGAVDQTLKPGIRPWSDSRLCSVPLETYASDFNIFLDRGTFIDAAERQALTPALWLKLLLKNARYLVRPNPRFWKAYRG